MLITAAAGAAALQWFLSHRYLLYYGDAQAHLNIARRLWDSRTPDFYQIGTVWLPLPHWLISLFTHNDEWWRTGLAGGIPGCASFALGGMFLFLAIRRLLDSSAAAWGALAIYAVNPNLLYLQSTSMTEPYLFAALFGALYFSVVARIRRSFLAAAAAGVLACAGTLVRYDMWFLLPFLFIYLIDAKGGLKLSLLFGFVAGLGPLSWFAHNYYYYSDPLEFYQGEWSAKAIYARQLAAGMAKYAGDHDWFQAFHYWGVAALLCVGLPTVVIGIAGSLIALKKKVFGPTVIFAALGAFYVWSMYSSGTPIFVPQLWPFSYYNIRYGLAALPLLALGAGALVTAVPKRFRTPAVFVVALAAVSPWLLNPTVENVVLWKESQKNSEARRNWTAQTAQFLKANYKGGGILTEFSDLTAVYALAGIPLRETLHEGNEPYWQGAVAKPELLLREEWVVCFSGGKISNMIQRSQKNGPFYDNVRVIVVKDAPVIEIYKRGSQFIQP